jgi:YD repeat-containing protein
VYDDDGRLANLSTGGSLVATYGYDQDSQLTGTSLANGIVEARTWDPGGRLTDITSSRTGSVVGRAHYDYDVAGNPTAMTDAAGTVTTYNYDGLDRLGAACFNTTDCSTAADYVRWTYDDVGHRLTEQRPAGTNSYTYVQAGVNIEDMLPEGVELWVLSPSGPPLKFVGNGR